MISTEHVHLITRNLRHFRVFLAVADVGSLTSAARLCNVSQPAVTQTLRKLEVYAGGPLFHRMPQGHLLTERGDVFMGRIKRAMSRLDAALAEVSPRLVRTATASQLQALVAVSEAQNFTLAARALGLSQPTVHRAVSLIELEAPRALFDRTSFGLVPSRMCRDLAQAARLAFLEFQQADADLAEFDGREVGQIKIGSLPLSRSVLLPEALARFREARPKQGITVLDGPYDEILGAVRRGDIDFMIGALRDPTPGHDIIQEPLFLDHLSILARPEHPLTACGRVSIKELANAAWVVPRRGTPSRAQFDAVFEDADHPPPTSILECGSILLMRELLNRSDMLGCISGHQAEAEVANGVVARLGTGIAWRGREIGLTSRAEWSPTRAQGLLLDVIRRTAAGMRRP